MDAKQTLRSAQNTAELIVNSYLDDFPDDQWDQRPHEDCNDLNWQFGHLLLAEANMIGGSVGQEYPLPAGFQQAYSKEGAAEPSPDRQSPAQLRELYKQFRAQTLSILDGLDDDQLDQPAAESIRSYCPTLADAFIMNASHWLMHTGQWVILRRIAKLPVVI